MTLEDQLPNFSKFPEDIKSGVEFIVEILSSIPIPNKPDVLDVGTGRGKMAIILASLGYDVKTGEPEDHRWANWKAKAQQAEVVDKIQFIPFRAENLPFETESFDLITIYGSFHHIEERVKAMHEFERVLRKNGILVIFEFTKKRIAELKRAMKHHPDMVEPMEYLDNLPFIVEKIEREMVFAEIFKKT